MFDPLHKWLGIPPSEQPPNDYRLLGVPLFEEDEEVIETGAAKQLAFLHDFDNGDFATEAAEMANRISAARIRLLSPEKREAYDTELRGQLNRSAESLRSPVKSTASPPLHFGQKKKTAWKSPSLLQTVIVVSVVVAAILLLAAIAGVISVMGSRPVLVAESSGNEVLENLRPSAKDIQQDAVTADAERKDVRPLADSPVSDQQPTTWERDQDLTSGQSRPSAEPPQDPASDEPAPRPRAQSQSTPSSGVSVQQNRPAPEANGDLDTQQVRTLHQLASLSLEELTSRVDPNAATRLGKDPDTSVDVVSPLTAKITPNVQRSKLPSSDVLQAKRNLVFDIFGADFDAAKTTRQRDELANRMRLEADGTAEDPVGAFTLLNMARGLYIQNNDFADAIACVVKMHQLFHEYEIASQTARVFVQVDRPAKSQLQNYSTLALQTAHTLLRQGRVNQADVLYKQVIRKLGSRKPSDHRAMYKQLGDELEIAQTLQASYQEAALKLEVDPTDPNALSILGKYRCFIQGRWEDALSSLAKCSDRELADLASAELRERSSEKPSLILIAALWLEWLSSDRDALQRQRVVERCQRLYRSGSTRLAGLQARMVTKRLESLEQMNRYSDDVLRRSADTLELRENVVVQETKVWNSFRSNDDFAKVVGNQMMVGMGETTLGYGEAAAGVLIRNAGAIQVMGTASHDSMVQRSPMTAVGFLVDFETPEGFQKRVLLSCERFSVRPFTPEVPFGKTGPIDEIHPIGRHGQYLLDLERWAPASWTGTSWFTLYMKDCGDERALSVIIQPIGRKIDF